jgi:hypothetical protein
MRFSAPSYSVQVLVGPLVRGLSENRGLTYSGVGFYPLYSVRKQWQAYCGLQERVSGWKIVSPEIRHTLHCNQLNSVQLGVFRCVGGQYSSGGCHWFCPRGAQGEREANNCCWSSTFTSAEGPVHSRRLKLFGVDNNSGSWLLSRVDVNGSEFGGRTSGDSQPASTV